MPHRRCRGLLAWTVPLLLIAVAACSESRGQKLRVAGPSGESDASGSHGPGGASDRLPSGERSSGSGVGNPAAPTGGFSAAAGGGAPVMPGMGASDPGSHGESGGEAADGGTDPIDIEPGQLTAGEWSDLDNWDFWRGLHAAPACNDTARCINNSVGARMSSRWGYETSGRISVDVRHEGSPVIDAVVTLRAEGDAVLWTARTDDDGRAELFANLFAESDGDYAVHVAAGGETVEVQGIALPAAEPIAVEFPIAYAPAPSLDLMFVIDTTGSMSDELSYIQAELGSVIERVRDEIGAQLAVRLSVNFYRDHGDEYVVRDFQFTSELDQALAQLAAQNANGGGDTPEAVEQALDNGVSDHTWSEAATARLLFLVLDAPPHYEPQRVASLHESTRAAAAKGVRIVPLAASGVDEQTEFLLRMLAISTNGTYTFLTDHSGIGNAHLEPTIGDYEVELLDDLLVRVIEDAL